MPIVRMPDGTNVKFPDDMPKEQIRGLISQKFPDVAPKSFSDKAKDFGSELGRQAGLTGRYLVEGAASIPTFIGDTANTAINATLGTNLEMPSEILSQGLTEAGVPEPRGGLERVVGDASRALTGTGATVKAGQALANIPSMEAVGKALSSRPDIQGRAAVGSTVASGATREAGGGPLAQLIAGVVGGGAASYEKPSRITSDDLKAKANMAYSRAKEEGATLDSSNTDQFIDEVIKTIPRNEVADALPTDKEVKKLASDLQALRGKPLTLEGAQTMDEYIGDLIDGEILPNGKPTKVGMRLADIQSTFRNTMDNASGSGAQSLKEGRKLWSSQARLRDIEKIISRAEMTDNPASAIKTGFRTLANNDKRLRGFSPQEKIAIKRAAESGIISDTLRTFGTRLIPAITMSSGGGAMNSALATVGSTLSRKGAEGVQMAKARKIADLIASGAVNVPPKDYTPAFLGTAQGEKDTLSKIMGSK